MFSRQKPPKVVYRTRPLFYTCFVAKSNTDPKERDVYYGLYAMNDKEARAKALDMAMMMHTKNAWEIWSITKIVVVCRSAAKITADAMIIHGADARVYFSMRYRPLLL